MALFKIFKGQSGNLGQSSNGTNKTYDGYAYFTPDDGKFYIDIATSNSAITTGANRNRVPLSAEKADLIKQHNTTNSENYKILLSYSANPQSGAIDKVNYGTNLTYNPVANELKTGNIELTGELDVTGNAYLRNETTADSLTAGSLLVNGAANFVQSPTGPTAAAGDSSTKLATTEFVANAFATNDTKVTQGTTTTTSWRKVLLNGGSADAYSAWDTDVAAKTDIVYQSKSIAVQPSTGTLKSTILQAGNLTIGGATTPAMNTIVSSSTLYLNRASSCSMIFQLNGTEHARFNTSGNLVIGLTSGQNDITDKLYVNGTSNFNGVVQVLANQYADSYSGALNMNNSNIYKLNSIYTADTSENASEGIHFYRDATHVDTLWMNGGNIYFVPNRILGTSTTAANSEKVTRLPAAITSARVVYTNGTTGLLAISDTTSTELGYVHGVTSAIQTQLNTKAPFASPALTGTPTAPTATAGTNTTQIATTAFVNAAISNGNAATATQVGNNLVLKINTGTTEGTNLYTFNGSAGKTVDFKAGNGISLTAAAGEVTIDGYMVEVVRLI